MNIFDVVIVMAIGAYCGYVLYKVLNKKEDCTHVCSTCTSSSCHLVDYTKQIQKIREK